jgi:hypothetical protein
MFLEEDEDHTNMRREKLKAFAKRYGLDSVIHLSQFLGKDFT